jgi:hypothetical protein
VRRAERRNGWRCIVRAEINNDIPLPYHRLQVVALVYLTHKLKVGMLGRASDQRPPHAAFGSGDNDIGHI